MFSLPSALKPFNPFAQFANRLPRQAKPTHALG